MPRAALAEVLSKVISIQTRSKNSNFLQFQEYKLSETEFLYPA